jgi:glycosyltransferase involved in cell wall biosynthesis
MKIVYVTSFYPPQRIAGAELGTQFMAEFMAQKGHQVHVVITRSQGKKYQHENRHHTIIHWLPASRWPFLKSISEITRALWTIWKIKPHMVHGNCLLPGGALAALATKFLGAKSLVLCYGYDVCDMSGLMAIFGRWALKNVDRVLAATNYCRSMVIKHVAEVEPQVFYAGCDETVFKLQPPRYLSGKKNLIFIGRMIPEKGLDFLLQVLVHLPENVELRVIGGGDVSRVKLICEKLELQQRVHFQGLVENSDLPKFFSQAHVMVLPSYREPFGVVCIEAILSGVPVVCSDVMGLPEAVMHGENGLVVKGRDPKTWAKFIMQAIEDEDLRARCVKNAGSMRKKWSWSTRLAELEKIYHEMMGLV